MLIDIDRKCGTCVHWFVFDDVTPRDHVWRPCNHPEVGGKGLAPLKRHDDSCAKQQRRREPCGECHLPHNSVCDICGAPAGPANHGRA